MRNLEFCEERKKKTKRKRRRKGKSKRRKYAVQRSDICAMKQGDSVNNTTRGTKRTSRQDAGTKHMCYKARTQCSWYDSDYKPAANHIHNQVLYISSSDQQAQHRQDIVPSHSKTHKTPPPHPAQPSQTPNHGNPTNPANNQACGNPSPNSGSVPIAPGYRMALSPAR